MPDELAEYEPELWERRVLASDYPAEHTVWNLPFEANNLYRNALDAQRLPFALWDKLLSRSIRVALQRAIAANEAEKGSQNG